MLVDVNFIDMLGERQSTGSDSPISTIVSMMSAFIYFLSGCGQVEDGLTKLAVWGRLRTCAEPGRESAGKNPSAMFFSQHFFCRKLKFQEGVLMELKVSD